jgi:6-phosphogluconolactonase/glucosamine-6-phosphate isomerase/deaminase
MSVRFVKITSAEPLVEYVAEALKRHLQTGERVLWLIAGGSVINVAVAAARKLSDVPLEHLTVSLTDERPGPVGHADSNWQQLLDASFEVPGARLQPVLTGAHTASDTAAFARFLEVEIERDTFRLGLFGIGPDGHTAGLPAKNAKSSDLLADHYEAGDFRRISSTPNAISRLDEAVVFVTGEPKHVQLDRLKLDLPYAKQSAQALKLAPTVTIFNDYKGDPV